MQGKINTQRIDRRAQRDPWDDDRGYSHEKRRKDRVQYRMDKRFNYDVNVDTCKSLILKREVQQFRDKIGRYLGPSEYVRKQTAEGKRQAKVENRLIICQTQQISIGSESTRYSVGSCQVCCSRTISTETDTDVSSAKQTNAANLLLYYLPYLNRSILSLIESRRGHRSCRPSTVPMSNDIRSFTSLNLILITLSIIPQVFQVLN